MLGVAGLELPSIEAEAESVEVRLLGGCLTELGPRAPGSLALSTSGTLPLLPELVSSDKPLSTPPGLKCFFSAVTWSETLGSWGLPPLRRSSSLYRLLPLLESSWSAGDRESPGGEIACTLGLYLEPLQPSLDTGDP